MNISKKVSQMINKISEDIEPMDIPPPKSNDEKLVSLLECIGLNEGFNFCYDEGEILIPDEVEFDLKKKLPQGKNVKLINFPGVSFDTTGKEIVATFISEDIEQSVVVPLYVYQLMLHYS
jgi:hypothetical protein